MTDSLALKVASLVDSYNAPYRDRQPIYFENLTVRGTGSIAAVASTVAATGSKLFSYFNPRAYRRPQPERTILHDFNGTINPGEMVLVIGKPGSGCTTFLKTLAGLRGEFHATEGTLRYADEEINETNNQVRATFCAEEDDHLPTLHVQETLRFAVETSWPHGAAARAKETATSTLAELHGLSHVLRTRIGSHSLRGLSGGERRRVTLAEALATTAPILCLDNPTNGLDSSTALEYIQMMREYTNHSRAATVMSVYQGSDAMVPLFDKVLVVSEGRQIFWGSVTEAKEWFEELGYECPEGTTVTDFLTSMTVGRVTAPVREGCHPPSTALELEKAFRASQHYQNLAQSLHEIKSMRFPSADKTPRHTYNIPLWRQTALLTKRQARVLVTHYGSSLTEAICITIQSLAIGTLFLQQPQSTSSFFTLSSSLFFCALVPALQAMAEFGAVFATRDLVQRQARRYRFYTPGAYALSLIATDVVWKVIAICYNIPQYFLIGYQYDAGKFFTWFLVLYVEHIAMSMIFRAVAVGSRSMSWAVLPVGVVINMGVLYTGLYVPVPQMKGWLSWIRYLNPLYYAWESIMVNELADLQYSCATADIVPNIDGLGVANQVCAVPGGRTGSLVVAGTDYLREQSGLNPSNLWRNLGINVALAIFFAGCTIVGMELYKPAEGRAVTVLYRKTTPQVEMYGAKYDAEKGLPEQTSSDINSSGPDTDDLEKMATHDGRTLSWKGLSLEVQVNGEKKRLLDNLDGSVHPRQLTALMGVSGAGKTTLLNTLAGRIETGNISGHIYIDGHRLPPSFSRLMGYVQQQDIHLPTQTVREALLATAHLRRPPSIPDVEKNAYVETILVVLDLQDLSEALIGAPGAGLTLEQRKRVSIGVELAAHPDVLFLDEPTSGLDGQSALNIVRLLRRLADSGQTVLCTIHQPAGEVIGLFDHLVLLAKGGRLAYNGALGSHCSTAVDYFAQKSQTPIEQGQNPAEYLLDIVGAGSRSTVTTDWASEWQSNTENTHHLTPTPSTGNNVPILDNSNKKYATSFWRQMTIILPRAWLYNWRDPDYFTAKLIMNMANGLVNGLTYLNTGSTVGGAYSFVLSIFMSMIVGPPLGLQTEERFFALRDIFLLRDKASGAYSWTVMVLSAILVEVPFALFTGVMYFVLWYYPAGYPTASDVAGYALLMCLLFHLFVLSLAQLVASLMPTLASAFMANGFFFMFLNTLSGTLSPKSVTPAGWSWYYQLNPLFYFGEGTVTNVLGNMDLTCSNRELFTFESPEGSTCADVVDGWIQDATGYLVNPQSSGACQYCPYADGESYYRQYEWQLDNRWRDVGILIGFTMFNYATVFGLTYLTKSHRWKRG